jgi:polar amino acid transport system substrate-binding protein
VRVLQGRVLREVRAARRIAAVCALGACIALAAAARPAAARDLVASIGATPNLGESPDRGPFVELVKAIDEAYPEGQIQRRVFPFLRSLDNVISGAADFHIPVLNNPASDVSALPYRVTSEKLGDVEYVLYSSAANPLTRERIDARQRSPGEPPFVIEALTGAPVQFFDFPVRLATWDESGGVAMGLRRVAAGRLDALIAPQEQSDAVLRELRLRGVHRARGQTFESTIAIARGPAGDALDAILSALLRSLKAEQRWRELFERAHRPYQDWQPAQEF